MGNLYSHFMEECLINTGVTACVRGLINFYKITSYDESFK